MENEIETIDYIDISQEGNELQQSDKKLENMKEKYLEYDYDKVRNNIMNNQPTTQSERSIRKSVRFCDK
jgi:hypothetical protein